MGFTISNTGGTVNSLAGPYEILFDSGITEAFPETGPTAKIVYNAVPWDSHYAFVASLIGQWTGTPPSTLIYTGPYQYPSSTNLMCTSVESIVPYGKPWISTVIPIPLPFLPRQYCRITANFTRPPYQPAASGGYFKVSFHSSGQFITVPNTVYHYGSSSGPLVANSQVGIVVPQAEITVTRYKMPFIPDFVMIPLLGTVNNDLFQILNNVYNPETLMFQTGNTDTEADVLGNITYTVEYKFLYNPRGWNNFISSDGVSGFVPVFDGANNQPYAPGNFTVLP